MSSEATDDRIPIYRHKKRTQWGLAILAWESDTQRGYQFEDGQLRTFKAGYYGLLEAVNEAEADVNLAEVTARLSRKLSVSQARQGVMERAADKGEKPYTLEDQIRVFRLEYPNGFQDPAWNESVRGEGSKRRLKRHRAPALKAAQEALAPEKFGALVGEGRHDEAYKVLVEFLSTTDMVRPAQMKIFKGIAEEKRQLIVEHVSDILYNADSSRKSFDRLVVELCRGDECGWSLPTVFSALLRPNEDVCVRGTSFKQQALWMAPNTTYVVRPSSKLYAHYREMAHAIRRELVAVGLKPRDLVDVYDFVRITLRPAAKQMAAQQAAQAAQARADANAAAEAADDSA